jgi:hypothetical protein
MKKQIYSLLIVAGLSVLAFVVSCKKNTTANPTLDAQVQQHNTDANNYRSESDDADQGINGNISGSTRLGGRMSGIQSDWLCGATIDTSQALTTKTITFNFDGTTSCFSPSRTRSGSIIVHLSHGNNWADTGAILTITYVHYKITYQATNHTIEFNGSKTLTNINGNNPLFWLSLASLKYRERANAIQVTFDGTQTATWNSARLTQWDWFQANSNPLHVPYPYLNFTANGDTTVNGYTTTDTWGTNRYGQPFTLSYSSQWTSNSYCGFWRPNSGTLTLHLNGNTYTLTLGVDTSGNPVSGTCGYGFKVTWSTTNANGSQVFSY